MDEKMANTSDAKLDGTDVLTSQSWLVYLIVALIAGAVYLGCSVSPPSLMDDVDAAVAQISRNMVTSGDWVTPRVDGIVFLEKPAMFYWPMAVSFKIFGVHDWAARIPFALSAIGLACLTCAFGAWAFGRRAGLCAGLCMATCVGLFLFTRIVIPDVTLTFTIALAMWAFLRALDDEEPHLRLWTLDRKSTRLNSSHSQISYAVFCLKKKKKKHESMCAPLREITVIATTRTIC